MDGRQNAYFTTLLQNGIQDGMILENHSLMEPENEIGFTCYANPRAEVFTQASQTGIANAEVLVQASQTPTQKGSAPKRAHRGCKFSIEEDRMLVSAYLNISLDAVHGNVQKLQTYWRRIWEYFQENMPLAQRNETSLMCRWSTIQLSVNKFCGSFAQIELKHQSGMTEEDKVSEAKDHYKEIHGSAFQFEHCWNILKYQPKWMGDVEKRKPKKNKTSTCSAPEVIDLGKDDAILEDVERPLGNKATKLKKRKATEILSSPLLGILIEMKEEQKIMVHKKMDMFQQLHVQEQERHQIDKERLHQEKERNTIKKDMLRMEQLKEEERIMLVETSALPPAKKEYYEGRQMEILEERKSKAQKC